MAKVNCTFADFNFISFYYKRLLCLLSTLFPPKNIYWLFLPLNLIPYSSAYLLQVLTDILIDFLVGHNSDKSSANPNAPV